MSLLYYSSVFMLGFRGPTIKGIKIADIFIVLLFISLLYRILVENEKLRWDRTFTLFYALLTIAVMVSLLNVNNFTFAKLDPFRYLLVGMFALSTVHFLDSKKKIKTTFRVLLIAGVIAAVFSLVVFSLWTSGYEGVTPFLHHIETGEAEGRVQPLFYDPNHYGGFFILPILALTYFLLTSIEKSNRFNSILYYLTGILLAAGLVTTGSRSAVGSVVVAWISAIVLFLLIPSWWGLSFDKNISMGKILVLASLVLVLIFFWFGYNRIGESQGTGRYGNVQGGFQTRLQLWSASFIAFSQNPFIGVGTSDFIHEYPAIARTHGFDPETQFFPHNSYLDLLAETGLFGFLSGACLLIYVYFTNFRIIKKSEGSLLSVSLLLLLLAQSAHMFFLSMFHARRLWLVFALIIAANRLIKDVRFQPGGNNGPIKPGDSA